MTVEEYRKLVAKTKGKSKRVISGDKAPPMGSGDALISVKVGDIETHYIPEWNAAMIEFWRKYKAPADAEALRNKKLQ